MALAPLVALALLAPGAAQDEARYTVRAENMEPRFSIDDRVRFDLRAYATSAPAVGDIVLIRPPADVVNDNGCARPREKRDDELCVRARPQPAPEPLRYITRVVAVGGDRIRFRRGRVVRNGVVETRKGIRSCGGALECTSRRAITVPPGHVYLAGDNRPFSDDSRFWGAIPNAWVTGRYAGPG